MTEWKNIPRNKTKYVGFVYKVVEKDTGMIYFGIKKFWRKIRRKPLKGKKRKRIELIETDWRKYNTSSKIMQKKLAENPSNYTKEIIRPCYKVSDMKAWEAWYQLDYYVKGDWNKLYNEYIGLRMRIR